MTRKRACGLLAALLVAGGVTMACAACDGSAGRPAARPQARAASRRADGSKAELGKGGTQLDYSQPTPPAVPTAQPLGSDDPRIGALFATDGYGSHFCTASVVRSPGHDLLMTAAHCISNGDDQGNLGIVFIPGYADGTAPYGVWTPRALIVDPRWAHGGNPAYDVGFVVLNPSNDGKNIQDVLGANQVDFNAPSTRLVRVTGYPERDNTPVTCQNWATRYSSGQLRFSCGGFYGGTSGSPWIIASSAGQAAPQVVGVIGGYQKGGDTNSVSYCVYLGSAIKALYEQAQAAGTSPGVTSPGPVPAAS